MVCVTELSTFAGTPSFPHRKSSLEFPGEDRPRRVRTCLYADVAQNSRSLPLPEESLVCYTQLASTQGLAGEKPFLNWFLWAGSHFKFEIIQCQVLIPKPITKTCENCWFHSLSQQSAGCINATNWN